MITNFRFKACRISGNNLDDLFGDLRVLQALEPETKVLQLARETGIKGEPVSVRSIVIDERDCSRFYTVHDYGKVPQSGSFIELGSTEYTPQQLQRYRSA